MWFLCLQVILFVAGAYALLSGKLPLTEHLKLESRRARITGALLLLPAGLPVIYGLVFTIVAIASGHPQHFRPHAEVLDIPSMLGAITLAIVFLYMTRTNHASTG